MNLEDTKKTKILINRTVMIETKSVVRGSHWPCLTPQKDTTMSDFTYEEHLSISNHFTEKKRKLPANSIRLM